MALIVSPTQFTSKAMLKAKLEDNSLRLQDPSFNDPRNGGEPFTPREIQVGEKLVVVNHPQRTRYATIERTIKEWRVS
jgi:hypothetical protein